MAYLGNDLSKEKEKLRSAGDCLVCRLSERGVTEVINSWILKSSLLVAKCWTHSPECQGVREKPTQE